MTDSTTPVPGEPTEDEIRAASAWIRELQLNVPRVLELQRSILDRTVRNLNDPTLVAAVSTLSCEHHSCN